MTNGNTQRGLNSYIILGAWTLWRHRNDCMFNGVHPSIAAAAIMVGNEAKLWSMAGAKDLSLVAGLDSEDAT
ncbi:hypothetical protein PR202_gb23439 [Eleusine coracana subsp. coracana]|uniref:Uncharacterized protein n=1 Tax=Eleusine coracana subsp. coracana TaxID=191504 RepID=A0AAV5FIY4_ELECO|nr:hypothetical protein PR202_gb23439 [Eleusine coracana subsp. coracana]